VYLGEPYAFLMKFSYLSKKKLGGKGKREGGEITIKDDLALFGMIKSKDDTLQVMSLWISITKIL